MPDANQLNLPDSGTAEGMDLVPPGKVKCFITGQLRNATPEEQVRQDVARSLVEEYGYDKTDIDIEFSVKMGSRRKSVDIAVFNEGSKHAQRNLYIIAETKREDVRPSDKEEGVAQLSSYLSACPNSRFGLWVGRQRLAFEVVQDEGERRLKDIPDIPKKGETAVPKPTRGTLVPAVNLKQVFKRIHNYIYANQGLQKDKAFEELLKLIFIKVFDEQYSPTLQFYVLPGENIDTLRHRLNQVFANVQARYAYIFTGNETIDLNNAVLEYVVSELQRFSLVDTRTDVKGEAYEEIVGPNLRGDRGEFFTPRNVCNMTIDMIFALIPQQRLTSPGALKMLDPAVGTAGFLIAAIQKVKELFLTRGYKYDNLRDLVRETGDANLYGIDFNPFLVKVAQMNMVMHGDGSSNIVHANSLANPTTWDAEAKGLIQLGQFDVVVTNPPFGSFAVIDDPDLLKQYSLLDYDCTNPRSALPPEQLFIERCLDFLKPGGILGIVLPDSILTNPGLEWIRKWLLERVYVLASVDLPTATFEPHTGTQTSILILRKKSEVQKQVDQDYGIFMSIPDKVGHDRRGNPVFVTAPGGEIEVTEDGQPIIDDHLPIVAHLFKQWLVKKGMV